MKFWDKKFPALLALLIILGGIIVTTILTLGNNLFLIKATPSQNPSDVRVTNISDTSLTVSYTTSDEVVGTLNYGTDSKTLDNLVLDNRDQLSQTVNKYSSHSITVRQLSPSKTYYFEINSGNQKYLNAGNSYSAKTGPEISSKPLDQLPMSGKVLDSNGKEAADVLVYVDINGAAEISTLTKSDGSYTLPLNNLRDGSLSNYFSLPQGSIVAIQAQTNSSSAKATIGLNDLNPVPPITLSNEYDFSTQVAATVSQPEGSNQTATFPNVGVKQSPSTAIQTTTEPTQEPPATPSPTSIPSPTPTSEILSDNSAAQPSISPLPTLMPTGQSSVIIIPIALVLVSFGTFLFLATGKNS